eukprot:8634784-Alexandrium_andersonii.AAC.1
MIKPLPRSGPPRRSTAAASKSRTAVPSHLRAGHTSRSMSLLTPPTPPRRQLLRTRWQFGP